jgi:ABC-type nitrate/sulfonate/bicarbonate transport system substrate-binding protein
MSDGNLFRLSRRGLLKGIAAAVPLTIGLPAPGARAETASLRIGLLRNPVSGLIEVADRKGWFKEAGTTLDSTLFTGAAGPKVIQAMGGGSLDMSSVSATAALLAVANGAVPLKIISIATDPAPVFMLLSKPGIESMEALAGKRVSTPKGTGLQYFLARALKKHGMSMKDVDYVNLSAADGQSAFLAGQVDAIVPSVIGAFVIQKIKPDTKKLFTLADFSRGPGPATSFVDHDVFVVPDNVLNTRPDALKAFLAGYHDKAVPYLKDKATQEQAIADITEYVNTEQKTPTDAGIVRSLMLESGFFDRAEAKKIMTSDDFVSGLEDQVQFFVDSGQLSKAGPIRDAVVTNLL